LSWFGPGLAAGIRRLVFIWMQRFAKVCNFSPFGGFSWHNQMLPMKTALISVLTATLLGFASLASGRPFDAADFTAIIFTIGLVAWTVTQYSREPRRLLVARPIRVPAPIPARVSVSSARRLAA
jgi:hypothetical protein